MTMSEVLKHLTSKTHKIMNTQETIIQLKDLKLRGMASSLEAIMNTPVQNRPSLNVAVAKLVDAELQDRRERKTEMYLKISRLRYTALIEDVVCGTERNFTKEDLDKLKFAIFVLLSNFKTLYRPDI